MKRRVDRIDRWWAGRLAGSEDGLAVWRYALVAGDLAVALVVSETICKLEMHRAFTLEGDGDEDEWASSDLGDGWGRRGPCDLLAGGECVVDPRGPGVFLPNGRVAGHLEVNGLDFWARYAQQGSVEQPDSFWRALDREARRWAKYARRRRQITTPCPRCSGRRGDACEKCEGLGWVPRT